MIFEQLYSDLKSDKKLWNGEISARIDSGESVARSSKIINGFSINSTANFLFENLATNKVETLCAYLHYWLSQYMPNIIEQRIKLESSPINETECDLLAIISFTDHIKFVADSSGVFQMDHNKYNVKNTVDFSNPKLTDFKRVKNV